MARLSKRVRFIAGALALMFVLAFAGATTRPAFAQVDPNAAAVKEQQLLDKLNVIQGRGTIPDTKSYVLEHPAGLH